MARRNKGWDPPLKSTIIKISEDVEILCLDSRLLNRICEIAEKSHQKQKRRERKLKEK